MNAEKIRRIVGMLTGRMPPIDVITDAECMLNMAVEKDTDMAEAITDIQQVVLGMAITMATMNRMMIPEDHVKEDEAEMQ